MELQEHAAGISVPLLDSHGNFMAQFGIAGPVAMFPGKHEIFLQYIRDTAADFIRCLYP
jgi:DNA-binding IclR family transcriptional regulator